MSWALGLVAFAAILDIFANLFLKKSNAFTHKGYTIACILMVWAAFIALTFTLETLPLSVAYSTWGAVGIIGTTAGGYILFKERIGAIGYLGIIIVLCAVILLHVEI